MTSDYATLLPTLTAPRPSTRCAARRPTSRRSTTAYIVDSGTPLLGVVSLRDILLARSRQTVGEIMEPDR